MAKGKVVLGGQAQRKSKVNLASTFGIKGSSGSAKTGAVTTSVRGKRTNVASATRKVLG